MSLVPLKNVAIGEFVECYGQICLVLTTTFMTPNYVELVSLKSYARISVPCNHLVKVIKKYDWRKHCKTYKKLLLK